MANVIMHGYERRLSSGVEPAEQLVADVWEPGECLEIISLTVGEVFEHLGIFVQTTGRGDVFPFGQTGLLKTLFEQWKQCGTIALLVHRQAQNNL